VLKGEPPMQARQRIDILSLAQLEETSQDAPGGLMNAGSRAAANAPRPISEQPIFWTAIAGWGFGLVCLLALLIVALFGGWALGTRVPPLKCPPSGPSRSGIA